MNAHAVYARISPRFRRERMQRFHAAINPRPGERILDVGGTPWFWENDGARHAAGGAMITLLNRGLEVAAAAHCHGMRFVKADGCQLPFATGEFDVVFSNSVLEHVGTWERQQAFAAEARRVGRRLWIQTPAREFLVEPHLLAPFVHWLPRDAQKRLIRNFTPRGWMDRPTPREIETFLAEVRLLSFSEMQSLFPDCTIVRERFLGLTKSYIAVRTTVS